LDVYFEEICMSSRRHAHWLSWLLLFALPVAHAADFAAELLTLQEDWARANYAAPSDARTATFEQLSQRAADFAKQYPERAEPLVWQGIILSTYAGAKGGLGALSVAKQSRARFEAAMKIDPNVLNGSAYTSLGVLYHKVPGFPLAFGSDNKAREYLQKGLAINPDGIDPNFFYGQFLLDKGEAKQALPYLEKALRAPARPGRPLADDGRRKEVATLLAQAKAKV
jgi:tetratricopeptide (TPR) repeat protein